MFLGFALFSPPFSIGFVSLLKKNIDGLFHFFFMHMLQSLITKSAPCLLVYFLKWLEIVI